MTAKKVLWLSEHRPCQAQVDGLAQIFGSDVEVCKDVNAFKNAQEILRRFQKGGYDDLVVVAPVSVIDHLCRLGLRPLYSETKEVRDRSRADFIYHGRTYQFIRYRRVGGIRWEWVDINQPCFERGKEDRT